MELKKKYIEYLRVFAAFLVIFNHTQSNGYFLFSLYPSNSFQFWIYMFISIFCRASVPLFFMISGVLMLDKDYDNKTIILKIIKYFFILFCISLFYYIDELIANNGEIDILEFWRYLYSSQIKYHLWYIYIYIYHICSLYHFFEF